MNVPIPYDLGNKVLSGLHFEPPNDEFGHSYFVIASKQGHLFKFNTVYLNPSNNTDKETDVSIQIELIYDKLVIDRVDKLSISKRKTQFLTSSSRNDICVKSFSNEN